MRQALVLLMIGVIFSGCTENDSMELADFTSDGCSLFIDGTFENPELWKECCLKHDIAYWQEVPKNKGSRQTWLKTVWKKKTGDSTLAYLMYEAVRAGGEPHFPTWYRWGYGWPIGRGYKELTLSEKK